MSSSPCHAVTWWVTLYLISHFTTLALRAVLRTCVALWIWQPFMDVKINWMDSTWKLDPCYTNYGPLIRCIWIMIGLIIEFYWILHYFCRLLAKIDGMKICVLLTQETTSAPVYDYIMSIIVLNTLLSRKRGGGEVCNHSVVMILAHWSGLLLTLMNVNGYLCVSNTSVVTNYDYCWIAGHYVVLPLANVLAVHIYSYTVCNITCLLYLYVRL